jgi:hypothetical protein
MVIVEDVIGGILGVYLLAWVVALAFMVFLALVLVVSRGRSDSLRDVFRRAVAAGARQGAVHAAGTAGSPADTATAVAELQSVDPRFDVTAFLDSARIAVGAYAMAHSAQDDRLLRRITTSSYWQTPNGKALAAGMAEWQRYAGDRPGATNRGRMVLDISWRQPELKDVALDRRGGGAGLAADRRGYAVRLGLRPARGPNDRPGSRVAPSDMRRLRWPLPFRSGRRLSLLPCGPARHPGRLAP